VLREVQTSPSRLGLGVPRSIKGTVLFAQRILLREIGFDAEAIDWHTANPSLPADRRAARDSAAWILR
jgi:hypothetical protein